MNQQPVRSSDHDASKTYQQHLVPAIFASASEILLHYAAPQPGERVLDVACGTGVVTRHAALRVGGTGHVAGIDLDPAMLHVAVNLTQPTVPLIEWRQGNAEALPYEDATYDLVLCQHGLQFIDNKRAAAAEMRRVLVSGGRVAINVHQSLDQNPVYKVMNDSLTRRLGTPALARSFSFGDADQLRALLDEAGFRDIEIVQAVHNATFPSIEVFAHVSLLGSGQPLPELATLNAAERAELLASVERDLRDSLAPYLNDGPLVFPMTMNVACARA
jgi:ubiquinone/menaquinone biosynthesis C-methylase UbiE